MQGRIRILESPGPVKHGTESATLIHTIFFNCLISKLKQLYSKYVYFSAYFCFITLTTIGFGDFTPDQKNVDGEQR